MSYFSDDCAIVFGVILSEKEAVQCYVPQPSFSRSEGVLPIFGVLADKLPTFKQVSYPIDFPLHLKRAIKEAEKQGFTQKELKYAYTAWIEECKSMAYVIDPKSKEKKMLLEYLGSKEEQYKERFLKLFEAWLCFFFCLCRYFSHALQDLKELERSYTPLSLEDYAKSFLKYSEVMEKSIKK